MFLSSDRTLALKAIGALGANACQYTQGVPATAAGAHFQRRREVDIDAAVAAWHRTRCDCKFGAQMRGEQTGCPEMRTLHEVLSWLTDDQWKLLVELAAQGGGHRAQGNAAYRQMIEHARGD